MRLLSLVLLLFFGRGEVADAHHEDYRQCHQGDIGWFIISVDEEHGGADIILINVEPRNNGTEYAPNEIICILPGDVQIYVFNRALKMRGKGDGKDLPHTGDPRGAAVSLFQMQ